LQKVWPFLFLKQRRSSWAGEGDVEGDAATAFLSAACGAGEPGAAEAELALAGVGAALGAIFLGAGTVWAFLSSSTWLF
jgi:hypothetical protein